MYIQQRAGARRRRKAFNNRTWLVMVGGEEVAGAADVVAAEV